MAERVRLWEDWKFHLGDVADGGFMGMDDRAWRTVCLPHDWAVEHPFDISHASGTGYLPGGTAWYRKHFTLPEETVGKRVRMTFQGIYKHARVYVNSHFLGSHACGYTSFTMDLTPFVRPGENVIAVRVEHEEVADSRWYTGSGMDRDVLMNITEMNAFEQDGIFVTTESLEPDRACLRIRSEILGEGRCVCTLREEGRIVAESEDGGTGESRMEIRAPRLWHPDHPFLYDLEARLLDGDGRVMDTEHLSVGIRAFRFDPREGLIFNGEPLKIRGVCVHHDAGCLGAAVPECVWRRRLEKLKACGCNAIRTAHNPPDPGLLHLCDAMGFLVMDEAFDEWEGIKNKWWQGHNVYPPKHFGYGEDFPEWHVRDLTGMVRRDRNHPSILLWSIGNEIDYPNDPYVTPLFREVLGNNDAGKPAAERVYDPRKPDAGRLVTVARELVDLVHAVDDSRPVTSAMSFPELSNRTGFADTLDLSGYNYREQFYDEDHRLYPDRPILGSENSHAPEAWYAAEDRKFIAGQFLWTGVDFLGECRGWPVRISQAGMLNLAGFEKPLYYQRRALWTRQPFVRIAVGEGESERHGVWDEHFRWSGSPGEARRVSLYTNQSHCRLFLNGRLVGEKDIGPRDGCRAVFEIPYEEGELEAVAGDARDQLRTTEAAERISLNALKDGNIFQVELELQDMQGQAAKDEDVFAQVLGDAEILGMENGKPDDLLPYPEKHRMTWDGRLILYLRVRSTSQLFVWTRSGLTETVGLEMEE